MLLFPRLPRAVATQLAEQRAGLAIAELHELAELSHPSAAYAPTGGARISEDALGELATFVRSLAGECGYPEPRSVAAKDQFDGRVGQLLHARAGLSTSEACRDEVWNFIGCVLMPDVVRWRSPSDITPIKNFLGKDRGIDNTFGRCWWAAELLRDDRSPADPYGLLVELGVDETVGFSRRARAITNRRVAAGLARAVVDLHANGFHGPRLELMRDAMKRFLRLASFVGFEFLTDDELELGMWRLVDASARHLSATAGFGHDPTPPPVVTPSRPTALPTPLPTPPPRKTPAQPPAPVTADATLSSLLLEIDVDSLEPNRFAKVKEWLGGLLGVDSSDVSIKRLTDAKNFRNRLGEALRRHPAVVLLLGSDDLTGIEAAIVSRLHLSPGSTILVGEQASLDGEWRVSLICSSKNLADHLGSTRVFPDARLALIELPEAPVCELSLGQRRQLEVELETLPFGLDEPIAVVEATVVRVTGLTPRSKRIVDAKNVGNRISEGLGVGAPFLVIGVSVDLFDSAIAKAREQLDELGRGHAVVVVPEDADGALAESPVYLDSEGPRDEDVGEDGGTHDDAESDGDAAAGIRTHESAVSFWALETLEERSRMVAEHLLFLGPLTRHEAIRSAAELMREAGSLDYQRLRTNGRIHDAILQAIEFGLRTGDFDRPRWGHIRATLTSPDDFSREDWIRAFLSAIPRGEPIARETVVRMVAAWAAEMLGLEYERIRRNGRIDKGVRSAIRALVRRNVIEVTSPDEIVLVGDAHD